MPRSLKLALAVSFLSGVILVPIARALRAPSMIQQAVAGVTIGGRMLVYDSGCVPRFNTRLASLANCAANGTTTTTVAPGNYLMATTNETVNLCDASTCAANGTPFTVGTQMLVTFPAAQAVSCRSTGATAGVTFMPCDPVR